MFFLPTKNCKEYRLEGRLVGHKNTINCLAVSRNGSLLASGGSDGTRIWDLKQQLQLPSPRQNVALRNPANSMTCVCWITRQDATHETLCYGTRLGFIGIWQQQGEGKEITCLTYDHAGDDTRIATGTWDKHVQVWSFDFKGPLILIFSIKLSTTIPCTINFNHTASRDLLVFGMYDGEVHALWGTDGAIIATNNAGPLIGHASVDITQTLFLIDNVTNGFSLHQLDDAVCITTYNTNPVKTFLKQVVFGEKTDIVVGGSDTGVVYVFDKNEGNLKQVSRHANKTRVQVVTVRHFHSWLFKCLTDCKTYDGTYHSIIVGAMSQDDTELIISVWSRQRNNLETPRPFGRALKNFVRGIVQLVITMVLIAYNLWEISGETWLDHTSPQMMTSVSGWSSILNTEGTWQEIQMKIGYVLGKERPEY
ncbi:WD40-repeat-containing domain protein [Suillus plorans]|uniref:WD40-repeat-containing domain protein n=1 Tax=Suillus plorans TaxID=116603 RepID=A0A9P7DGU1_9AGAM|nr:WD40-repeat-containing domain protein [Suillus plorans]KAG1793681.1 WD40-repeat-containing domain protein [Suillus plorans]